MIRSYAKAEWEPAQDALSSMESLSLENSQARMDKLKPWVLRSARASSTRMFVYCVEAKSQTCGQTLIDGMLDALEAKQASAMVRMAALYSAGLGVSQDAEASIKLLKAAEKRTGDKGNALYDFMFLQFDKGQVAAMPAKLMDYLEAESFLPGKGKAASSFVYMQMRKMGNEAALQKYGARLEASALAGVEDSYELYAIYEGAKENQAKYDRWIEAAARAGHAFSQYYYASALQDSKDAAKQSQAFDWMLESARNGNLKAINWVADEYYDRQRWEEAAAWYESASDEGDIDASFDLAELYANAPKGTSYTETDAVAIYQSLSENGDSAKARREWAKLLVFGTTLKHDPVKARQLIQQDVDKNDSDSMSLLGSLLLYGNLGAVDEKNGMSWLEKAESAGNVDAANTLAAYLYFRKSDEASLKKAKSLWLRASLKKYLPAINNFAWTLCTSSYPGYQDPKGGMALFKLVDTENLPPSYRDSYAACLAATGDFKAAIVNQQRVIDDIKKRGLEENAAVPEMRDRLALYSKNQVYIELPETVKP